MDHGSCYWYRTGSGSDRVKHSTFVRTCNSHARALKRFQRGNLFDSRGKWLDPFATVPGSVPTALFGSIAPRARPPTSAACRKPEPQGKVSYLRLPRLLRTARKVNAVSPPSESIMLS